MATETQQTREAVTVDDVVRFKVSISVSDKGNLPSAALFVIQIVDEDDSKDDLFARVATLPDFDEIQTGRTQAIADAEDYYRVSAFILWYDNLATAVHSQNVLKAHIDELVSDYDLYQSDFVTAVETTVHPQIGADTYTAAVTGYQDALRNSLNAEAVRDTTEADYSAKVTAASEAATAQTKAEEISTECAQTKGFFDTLSVAFTALDANGDTILAAAEAYYTLNVTSPVPTSGDIALRTALDTFTAALRVSEAQKTQSATEQITFATVCGKRSTENTTAQTDKTAADTALSTARSTFEDAQTAVETAQQAENAALAAVQALKPDFDPTSVEPTPVET